jgi:riboflavin biosynthesis pyrimidine reductase
MLPAAYTNPPRVRANLVQGANSLFVDSNNSSRGISNEIDRERLLELRRLADIVVTDGETARLEQYRIPMTCDLAVITRGGYTPAPGKSTHSYLEVRESPTAAIERLISLGYRSILLEVGPRLIRQLVANGLLDELCLTNTAFSKPQLTDLGIARAVEEYRQTSGDTTFTLWREIQPL